jgi:hypothetical protein
MSIINDTYGPVMIIREYQFFSQRTALNNLEIFPVEQGLGKGIYHKERGTDYKLWFPFC